jgi:hypothetical protein
VTAALAAATVFVGSATSSPSEAVAPSPGGVFVVTYAPQPLTSALSQIRVRFTTTGQARLGWEYYVYLALKPRPKKTRCAHTAASWNPATARHVQHISGAPGKTYTVWLRAAKSLGGHFCPGRGILEIGTGPPGHEASRRRPLRLVPVTILRAN